MTCKEVYVWLLGADAPPAEVRRHLDCCRKCRRRRRRLLRLDDEVRDLPAPVDRPEARAALLQRVERLAQEGAVPPRRPRAWRSRAVRAAAMLLVATGFFWSLTPGRDGPDGPRPVIEPAPPEADVLARALERQLQLAAGLPQPERFKVLVGLAGDLGTESLRLARQPAAADLPAVAKLYERVMREGVVGRARRLPAEQQRRLLVPLLDDLRRTEAEVERTARDVPAEAAAALRGLAATARAARAELGQLLEDNAL
jgi:hypothetical protein